MEGSGISWYFWLSFPSLGAGQTIPHQTQIPGCGNVLILMPYSPAESLSCLFRRSLGLSKADVGAKGHGVWKRDLWLHRGPGLRKRRLDRNWKCLEFNPKG